MSTIEQQDLHLSEDLILEILSRLPPITLVRFKSVSKTWYSLISNPDFCRRNTALFHMLEEPSPPPDILLKRGFCVRKSNNIVIYPHPHRRLDHEQKNLALLLQNLNDSRPVALNESSRPMLIDSCNGLLLYVHDSRVIRKEKKNIMCRTFYVCNPITNDYIKLPTIDMVDLDQVRNLHRINAHIVFNPSFSLTYKVFTWIPCTVKRSKSRWDSSYYGRLYVYSSEARSWRLSVSIPCLTKFPLYFCCDLKSVLWNGVLHWTTFLGGSTTDEVFPLCYDIEKETVWKMKFPKMATGGYTHRRLLYFGLCGERLLMIEKQYNHEDVLLEYRFPSSFDVFEKQEQNGDENEDMWTVRYRVNFEEVDNYNFYSEVIGSNTIYSASIFDIYRTMRTKNEEDQVVDEVMLMKVGPVVNTDRNIDRIIFFNLTSNTFGDEKLRNRKIELRTIGFLNYANILQYNVTLFPPRF